MSPVVLKSQLIYLVPHSGVWQLLDTKIFYELPFIVYIDGQHYSNSKVSILTQKRSVFTQKNDVFRKVDARVSKFFGVKKVVFLAILKLIYT